LAETEEPEQYTLQARAKDAGDVLAVAQMGIHLVFFLHITTGPDNTNSILALAFGILIVTVIVAGSLIIMANLADNLMSPESMNLPCATDWSSVSRRWFQRPCSWRAPARAARHPVVRLALIEDHRHAQAV
jgi:hypothetical protein